ncbi:hypothetical protein FKW77_003760 [Venturia effusa]|uniref:RNA polymerase II transcription factor B subunit 3 n=1 Tax=Venturia effusa TaxID=50376 RepID=A0A517L907_9PEZI|nr:hypothetical protein FKW77_003760 [Venturia effusa]
MNPGIDDALIVFNMIPLTGLTVALCLGFKDYGFDRHIWNSPLPKLEKARQILMAIELLYLVSTSATKVSILLFYRRLAKGTISTPFRYAVKAAIASVVIYLLYFFINLIFTCNPVEAFWKQVDPVWATQHKGEFRCHGEASNLIASAVVSVLHDFIACGLPVLLLWKLQISKNQKLALGSLFSLGLFVCLAGILRLAAIPHLYFNTYDTTWDALPALLWLAVEAHIAVICASAPALKAYFKGSPAPSRYSPWPSDYSLSRSGSSTSSTKKYRFEKKSVPVVTDEEILGSYFNTTGGDQGDRVWFQGTGTKIFQARNPKKSRPRLDLDKALPRPPSYASFDYDIWQGLEPGFGYKSITYTAICGLALPISLVEMSKQAAGAGGRLPDDGGELLRNMANLHMRNPENTNHNPDKVPDEECPVCHSRRYLNKSMIFKINPECYHRLCNSCVDRLFSSGPATCPIAGCGKTLRGNKFRVPTFTDLALEREVDIRARVAAVYNREESDFETLRDYNDYLQQVEDVTFNLINRINVEATEREIKAYQAANLDLIEKNLKRAKAGTEDFAKRQELERRAERERRKKQRLEEEEERRIKDEQRRELIRQLEAGGDANELAKQNKLASLRRAKQVKERRDIEENASPAPIIKGLKIHVEPEKKKEKPYDPFDGMDYKREFYQIYDQYAWQAFDVLARDDRALAGGISFYEHKQRALCDAFSGLGVIIGEEPPIMDKMAGAALTTVDSTMDDVF